MLAVDVCLVLMPYAAVERPSVALGILKASLNATPFKAKALYANIWFADLLGPRLYNAVCERGDAADLIGEWTFSAAAFPDFHSDEEAYLDKVLDGSFSGTSYREYLGELNLRTTLKEVREKAPGFIDSVARTVLSMAPRIVGCSSVFQQHCASLALLRRIRELRPSVVTLLGGPNCEGPMGKATHDSFPWVDFVVSGEADLLFPDLCTSIMKFGTAVEPKDLPHGVIGPAHRKGSTPAPRAMVRELDKVPTPEYGDYFATLENSAIRPLVSPGLPIETSRGCWWGEVHHCTFCGLNGTGMQYRSKSPERVIVEFAQQAKRYSLQKFEVVDNILDNSHIDTVLPELARQEPAYSIFYETKANLKPDQMTRLADAGVRWVQPGIESMHDAALKLLDKGNSTWMNVRLLRTALELGIRVSWNFLFGIPGEQEEWYTEMASWLPLLSHLQPPSSMVRIRYDRFSPYQARPEHFGISLIPNSLYGYVYPVSPRTLHDMAYFFEDSEGSLREKFDPRRGYFSSIGLESLRNCIVEWYDLFWPSERGVQRPVLRKIDTGEEMTLLDTRPCATALVHKIEGLTYFVYRACDVAVSLSQLKQALQKHPQAAAAGEHEIELVIRDLLARRILVNLSGRFFSLATAGEPRPLLPLSEYPGGYLDLPERGRSETELPCPITMAETPELSNVADLGP